MQRLSELKAEAQRHYQEVLKWTDVPTKGHAWADVDHHTVSVMVDPPEGNSQIVVIRGGAQYPLKQTGEQIWYAQTAMGKSGVQNVKAQAIALPVTERTTIAPNVKGITFAHTVTGSESAIGVTGKEPSTSDLFERAYQLAMEL